MLSPDGNLFEYFDDNSEDRWTVSIEDFVNNWKMALPMVVNQI